ncbi:ribonuclease M5 [Clostridium acidisoli DSM 12555]|uniref:Ribonuclease M5 n=1 Tax=Clostridium acidisoli DSM 12555 TaxID=1121291 RepID=A0A1W1XR53_9CLOT|nr:ribonuclease M5 [Clostridium acidisoli]SMC26443.1 ribonuclease M5 [Clostridium acidisoli DSM 12555]
MIKEVIVVEGRDDISAIKRAVEADVIAVGGFGINKKVIDKIIDAQKRRGVIVFTDPDFAGEKIRRIITKRVKGVKHARISQKEGTKDGDIGVENALPKDIIRALKIAKFESTEKIETFNIQDMMFFKLTSDKKARERRDAVGRQLGIGYANSAQFLNRLNSFEITKEELVEAIKKAEKEI